MALLQCDMCCGELEISPDKSVGVCIYCGSTFTIPKTIEKNGNLFNRATYLRQNCDFDGAAKVYETLLSDNCEDVDALWGLVLCRYGIEFVEDPKTGSRIPTCHRASRSSILLDPDYKSAMQLADEEKRNVYCEAATKIDQIQKEIIALSDAQEKYDVFICYKETDDEGERTMDSFLAQDLYNELTRLNIKTFFARKTLEGKLGSSYEPVIYSALSSAKVMVVLGTKPAHFTATWVRNEWSRYLSFMRESNDKFLIPAFRDMSAYQLPEEFSSLQALDMSRIGFILDLCDSIKKLIGRKEEYSDTTKESLYSRAMVFLGNREFYKAVDYFEKVLDIDPKYARAYWGSLLASYQCTTANELVNCTADEDWTEDVRLQNALQFANTEERRLYENTVEKRILNFRSLANSALESKNYERCVTWCDKCLKATPTDGGIWWLKLLALYRARNSKELFDMCLSISESIHETEEYRRAMQYAIPEEAAMYKETAAKIEVAVKEKQRTTAYEECKTHMKTREAAMKRDKKNRLARQRSNYQAEMTAYSELLDHKGSFYGNNIFLFLLHMLMWAVPLYVGVVYLSVSNGSSGEALRTFLITAGIVLGIVVFIAMCTYFARTKNTPRLLDRCESAEAVLKKGQAEIELACEREARCQELIAQFLKTPNLSVEEIQQYRIQFDTCFANTEPG